MNSKRQEKVKLGHEVQIAAHVTLKFSSIINLVLYTFSFP